MGKKSEWFIHPPLELLTKSSMKWMKIAFLFCAEFIHRSMVKTSHPFLHFQGLSACAYLDHWAHFILSSHPANLHDFRDLGTIPQILYLVCKRSRSIWMDLWEWHGSSYNCVACLGLFVHDIREICFGVWSQLSLIIRLWKCYFVIAGNIWLG